MSSSAPRIRWCSSWTSVSATDTELRGELNPIAPKVHPYVALLGSVIDVSAKGTSVDTTVANAFAVSRSYWTRICHASLRRCCHLVSSSADGVGAGSPRPERNGSSASSATSRMIPLASARSRGMACQRTLVEDAFWPLPTGSTMVRFPESAMTTLSAIRSCATPHGSPTTSS